MEIKIREASAYDLSTLLSLYGQLGMDDGAVLTLDEALDIFVRMNAYPDYRLYVSVAEGIIVGSFALLIMNNLAHRGAPSGILEDVIVREGWRGKGIGKKMMAFAMERCAEKGCYKLALSSNLQRESAHAFYRSLGFRQHGYSFVVALTGMRQ
jgi:GNAT superfamily N-acetyltransferase